MSTPRSLSDIPPVSSDFYSCPLCSTPFTSANDSPHTPLILPCCGRSICASCFTKLIESNGSAPACPFDRISLGPVAASERPQLVRNRALIEVLERLGEFSLSFGYDSESSLMCGNDCSNPASLYCQSCEHDYCANCNEIVHVHKATRQHRRVPLAEKNSVLDSTPILCPRHLGNPLAMFCRSCAEPVCSICIVLKHQDHAAQLVSIAEGVEWANQAIEAVDEKSLPIAELEQQQAQLRKEIARVEQQRGRDVEQVMAEMEQKLERIHTRANASRKNIQLQIEERTLSLSQLGGILEEKRRIGRVNARSLINSLEVVARAKKFNSALSSLSSHATSTLHPSNRRKSNFKVETHDSPITSVAFSSDGCMLAIGACDKTVHLWDTNNWKKSSLLTDHEQTVCSVAFSPDCTMVASGSSDKTVRIWNTDGGQCLQVMRGHSKQVTAVCFSRDGHWLASASLDESICLWSTGSWDLFFSLKSDSAVHSIAYSPDQSMIVSGNYDGAIELWDLRDPARVNRVKRHNGIVKSVCFSPDGCVLASAATDGSIILWWVNRLNLKEKQTISTFKGINGLCFNHDGSIVASASTDHCIYLWNVNDGSLFKTIVGHSQAVNSICFSPDDSLLVSGSNDLTTHIWSNPLK